MAAYSAVVSLDHILARMIDYTDLLLPPLFLEIVEYAHKEMKSFQKFLERLDSCSRKRMKVSLERVPEEIQKFQKVFKSHYVKLAESFNGDGVQFSLDIQDLKQDAHSFIEKLKKVKEEEYCEEEAVSSSRVDSGGNMPKMVGLCGEYSKLKEELVGDWIDASYFSIFGMAGIGKTTLAMKIFEDLDIVELFDCRVWVTVGKTSRSNEVILAILAQVDPDAHELVITRGDEALAYSYLLNRLEDKRYLIMLDDVWDLDEVVWKCLLSFNKRKIRCRVLLTTRLRYLVGGENKTSHLLDMRLLHKEESWDLLRDKVFGENPCPSELEKVGKKIVEKCDGLPLTIVTVADLLSKVEKNRESLWIEVATHKKHQLFADVYDEISKVLYPSYNELHEELKLCLLYMGVFPLKCEISKSKLIDLWIVEEVFKPSVLTQFETLEASAATSLRHLALCSLVMAFQISSSFLGNGESIKTCGLHSSWWHFCQREARKNNFFLVLESYTDGLEDGIKNQSRLSIYNNVLFGIKDVRNSIEENCASTAHSLLCFGPYHQYAVPICFRLRLLQKLDALNIRFYEFPLEILEPINLRYLTLTCNGELPPSLSKLLELQHLIVGRHLSIKSHGFLPYLPMEIWYMRKLKHLQVMGNDLPNTDDFIFLENLSTLSDVSSNSCTKGVLERIPNLKKLGIRMELTLDAPKCCFDHICKLTRLESLKLVIRNHEVKCEVTTAVTSFPSQMFLPKHLKKLHLSGLGYPWTEASKIASLPSLEVLKLRCNAFEGPKWEIDENGFQNLTFLLIEDIDLVQLKGECGSFQCFNCLHVKHCYKLKELHLGDGNYIPKIEIVDCNPFVEREIQNIFVSSGDVPKHLLIHSLWIS